MRKSRKFGWKKLVATFLAFSMLFSGEATIANANEYISNGVEDGFESTIWEETQNTDYNEDYTSEQENISADIIIEEQEASEESTLALPEDLVELQGVSDEIVSEEFESEEVVSNDEIDFDIEDSDAYEENPDVITEELDNTNAEVIIDENTMEGTSEREVLSGWGEITEEDQLLFATLSGVPKGVWIGGVNETVYTGEATEFNIHVYDENLLLEEDVDYTVSYMNNVEAATADSTNPPTVIVTGMGNYTGQIQARYTIKPIALMTTDIQAEDIYVEYTGEIISPVIEIFYKDTKLENKKDYIFDIKNTKNVSKDAIEAGTYNIVLTGIGNFSGTRNIKLFVTSATLIEKAIFTPIEPLEFTGTALKPAIQLSYEDKELKIGTDFTVEYKNNINAGIATVKIIGKGNFAGKRVETFEIVGIDMNLIDVYDLRESYYYTGNEIKPAVRLVYTKGNDATALSTILNAKTDYTVTYENNKAVGLATVIYEGKGKYTGRIIRNFYIDKYDFNSEDGNLRIASTPIVTYVKGGCKPDITLTYYGRALVCGKDYTLKYANNKEAGNVKKQPMITITGIGNYTGVLKRNFIISQQDISNLEIFAPDMVYSKKEDKVYFHSRPEIMDTDGKFLKLGVDYRITKYMYKNRTVLENSRVRVAGDEVGKTDRMPIGTELLVTIAGIGNYTGNVTANYKIVLNDIRKAKVTVCSQYFTGMPITPGKNQITVKIGGKELRQSDYEIVGYYKNVNKGNAQVLIHGIGNYGGFAWGKFAIKVKEIKGNRIYFNGNGATSGKMSDLELSSIDTSCVLYPNAYGRVGYEFAGWNTSEDGIGTTYADCASYYIPGDKNGLIIPLYAQWKPCSYTITYYMNGGINVPGNPGHYLYNEGAVNFVSPVRNGYDFRGWYKSQSSKKKIESIKSGTLGNIVLYAKWKVKAPNIISAKRIGTKKNEIHFGYVEGGTKYIISRSTSVDGDYVVIGSTKSDTFIDKNALPGNIYYYKVRAYSSQTSCKGYGDYSTPVGVSGSY